MNARGRRRLVLAIVVVLAGGWGCGGNKPAPVVPVPGKPMLAIAVTPSSTSNGGRALHALVRAVTLEQFVEDQDRDVAHLVVSPDDSVLASFVVFPGIKQQVQIDRPAKGAVAVYFLFTGATGTSWKELFDTAPAAIRLELGDDRIVTVSTTPAEPAAGAAATGTATKSTRKTKK